MTKTNATPAQAEPVFAEGTTVTDSTGLDARSVQAQAATMADQKRDLTEETITLPCGTVLTTTSGVDLSFRVVGDHR